jgi:primosomal protein N' (replication factor Y)
VVIEAAQAGPTLVIHPAHGAARAIAARLRREGLRVALMPDEWASAAAGVDVVVGSRAAVWAPCPGLVAVVVLDEHDEALQEERTPTWHARDVAIERAHRMQAACVLVSPSPTVTALHWAGDRFARPPLGVEREGWPAVRIVDRNDEEPWKRSLVTSPLVEYLRDAQLRVVCVHNTAGRARLLACRSCRSLQRCERCGAAVAQDDARQFVCPRCAVQRPPVCQECGSSAMALVRRGVTRLREELEAAAGRPVVAVTGATGDVPPADVYVGTEAVLHRVRGVDVVAFLDLDAELLAPRYRAAEQAMVLLVRAARLVGPRSRGGVLVVQTHLPHHEVLQSALLADPSRLATAETERRELLGLPPFRALAAVDGDDADEFAAATGMETASTRTGVLLRADDWLELGHALADTPRPAGSRLRIEVDPPRR